MASPGLQLEYGTYSDYLAGMHCSNFGFGVSCSIPNYTGCMAPRARLYVVATKYLGAKVSYNE